MHTLKIKMIGLVLLISALSSCKTPSSMSDGFPDNSQQAQNDLADANNEPRQRPKSEIAKINAQLGIAYLEQKNVQRAKLKLLMALKQSPETPEPWYSMAYFLETTGNKDEARKYYMKAVQIAPNRGDTQNNYGTFLCREGQYQESIKHFMIAANTTDYLDPAAAYENAGLCAMKEDNFKQASGYFKQALLKDPARTQSLLKLAVVEAKLGHYKDAKEYLTQYSFVSPTSPESIELNAQIDKKLG